MSGSLSTRRGGAALLALLVCGLAALLFFSPLAVHDASAKTLSKVTGITAVSKSPMTATVKWNKAKRVEDGYTVRYDDHKDFSDWDEFYVKSTSFVLEGLNPNTTYYLKIRASLYNKGPWSKTIAVKTKKGSGKVIPCALINKRTLDMRYVNIGVELYKKAQKTQWTTGWSYKGTGAFAVPSSNEDGLAKSPAEVLTDIAAKAPAKKVSGPDRERYDFRDADFLKGRVNSIEFDSKTVLSEDFTFRGFDELYRITGLENMDLSHKESLYKMFANCGLVSMDLSAWDTSKVTSMKSMFYGCEDLEKVTGLDASSCVDMSSMFDGCEYLTKAVLTNTSACANMEGMFAECSYLKTAPSLDTSSCANSSFMFEKCKSLKSVPHYTFPALQNTEAMFLDCVSLKSLDASGWVTSATTNIDSMFSGCSALERIDMTGWSTSGVEDMACVFLECSALESLDLSAWDTSAATTMQSMFKECSNLKSLNMSGFQTSRVTTMSGMFCGLSSLTSLDVSSLDTSKVKSMQDMFCGCSSLTSLDVSGFNVSRSRSLDSMFAGCSSLVSVGYLGNWKTNDIYDVENMFNGCSSLKTLEGLSNWSPEDFKYATGMFAHCTSLTSIGDISSWKTGSLQYCDKMFYDCPVLTVDCSKLNVSPALSFGSCKDFCTGSPGVIAPAQLA